MFSSIHFFNTDQLIQQLRPLTDHRLPQDLLLGTSTIQQKWEKHISPNKSTPPIHLLGNLLPSNLLLEALEKLQTHQTLFYQNQAIAYFSNSSQNEAIHLSTIEAIWHPEDLLSYQKFFLLKEITPEPVDLQHLQSLGNTIICPENCYIHPSASLKGCILDASLGPILIGAGAQLQIGSLIQGPAAILEDAITNLGAKIRPFTSIGKNCKVGGEISFSIIHNNSNKSHDGYLGNSIVGSFCNFGALSNSSNVRNDLKEVSIYSFSTAEMRITGMKSIGLITGDYITTGIGSQFNTGTVIGSHSNITCPAFPAKFIPSFTWGVSPNFTRFSFEKAVESAKRWTESKNQVFEEKTLIRMKEIWKAL